MKPAVPVLLLGLALGAAAGSWGQRALLHHRMRRDRDPNRGRAQMLERMSRELGLDDKQKTAVSAVMESRAADVDKLKADTFVRLEAIRKSAEAEMGRILTPEQAAKLEALHRARPLRVNWEAPSSPAEPAR
jgi:Spy/CpxP family protein refolding chaperone